MTVKPVSLASKLASVDAYWTPKIVGELNQQHVKIAKFKGDFVAHKHDREDELFYVIDGQLHIELEAETLTINAGEFVIIPRGMTHRPFAPEEVSVLLFEPATTLNTGNVRNDLTVDQPDRG